MSDVETIRTKVLSSLRGQTTAQQAGDSLASKIDHTLLKASATAADIKRLCREAIEHKFAAVCVNPHWVNEAATHLHGSTVATCTVAGFPLGANDSSTKAFEAGRAVAAGATEVDMVIDLASIKQQQWQDACRDIQAVVSACAGAALVKVILEICELSDDEVIASSAISEEAGANYVKTSTGFGTSGATTAAVTLMRQTVGGRLGVKASGGIRDMKAAQAMLAAGASRLGTSRSVAIIGEQS